MKILHVAETLKGGLETYLRSVAIYQARAKQVEELVFILPEQVDWLPNNVRLHLLASKRAPLELVRYIQLLGDLITRKNPDVVHAHSSFAGAAVRLLKMLGRLPPQAKIVYCSHGWAFDLPNSRLKNLLYGQVERLLSFFTHAIVCISEHEVRIAHEVGIQSNKLIFIPNGVDFEPTTSRQQALGDPASERRKVLFVGRLDRQKGIDLLIDAYLKVRPDFDLVVVGEPVRHDVAYQRPAEIEFLGWLKGDELNAVYTRCDALIVPSRWEGFGLVAVEAMARSKAVFAARAGGLVEIIDNGRTGMLFELDDLENVLRTIEAASAHTLSAMGQQGYAKFTENYTSQRMNQKLLDLYQSSEMRMSRAA